MNLLGYWVAGVVVAMPFIDHKKAFAIVQFFKRKQTRFDRISAESIVDDSRRPFETTNLLPCTPPRPLIAFDTIHKSINHWRIFIALGNEQQIGPRALMSSFQTQKHHQNPRKTSEFAIKSFQTHASVCDVRARWSAMDEKLPLSHAHIHTCERLVHNHKKWRHMRQMCRC